MWQCTSGSKCINCKGSQASNDSKCPVYAVYAKAAQDRFVGKVVAGLDNVVMKESLHFVPGAAPVPTSTIDGERPSFAQVVGKPAMMALVRTTDKGESVVCYLPKQPTSTRVVSQPAKTKAKQPPQARKELAAELDPDVLIKSITARVIEKVSESLDSMISRIVAAAIADATPRIAQAVVALLGGSSPTGLPISFRPDSNLRGRGCSPATLPSADTVQQ